MHLTYRYKRKLLGRLFMLTSNTTHYNSEDIQRILAYGHENGPKLAEKIHNIQVLQMRELDTRGWYDHMHTCVGRCYRIRRGQTRQSSEVVLPRRAHRQLIHVLLAWNTSDCLDRCAHYFLDGTRPSFEVPGDAVTQAHDKMVDLRLRFLEEAEALGPIRIHRTANKVSAAERTALLVEKMQTVAEEAEFNLRCSKKYLDKTVRTLMRLKRTLPSETWQFEELLTMATQMGVKLGERLDQVESHYQTLSAHPFSEDTE